MSNSHSRHALQLLDGVMEVLRIAVAPGCVRSFMIGSGIFRSWLRSVMPFLSSETQYSSTRALPYVARFKKPRISGWLMAHESMTKV